MSAESRDAAPTPGWGGAALMYFLDPERGTRRRHLVRDLLALRPGPTPAAGVVR